MEKKRVVIAGITGLLGSRIAHSLVHLGYEVTGISRTPSIDLSQILDIEINIVDWYDIDSIRFACIHADTVINCMGLNRRACEQDPKTAFDINQSHVARMAYALHHTNIKKLIHFSTVHVYADNLHGTYTENSVPLCTHPYSLSKLKGETEILKGSLRSKTVILRLANCFGFPITDREDYYDTVIPDMCRQAITTSQITLQKSGKNTRDFLTISTLSNIITQIINKPIDKPIMNISTGQSVTLRTIAELIKKCCKEDFGIDVSINEGVDLDSFEHTIDNSLLKELMCNDIQHKADLAFEILGILRYIANKIK